MSHVCIEQVIVWSIHECEWVSNCSEVLEIFALLSVVAPCFSPSGDHGYMHNAVFLIIWLAPLRHVVNKTQLIFVAYCLCHVSLRDHPSPKSTISLSESTSQVHYFLLCFRTIELWNHFFWHRYDFDWKAKEFARQKKKSFDSCQ